MHSPYSFSSENFLVLNGDELHFQKFMPTKECHIFFFFHKLENRVEGKGTYDVKRDIGIHPPRDGELVTFQGSPNSHETSDSSPSHQGNTDLFIF